MARSTSLLLRNATNSPLGSISLAGYMRKKTRILPAEPRRVLGSYGLVYILAGAGHFADETGLDTPVEAGDLLVLFPDVAHSYGPPDGGTWSELFIVIDGPLLDLWRRHGLLDPARPVWHLEPVGRWAKAFDHALGRERPLSSAATLRDVSRLAAVLAEALVEVESGRTAEDRDWLARACALLDADVRREIDLHEIAAGLSMSYDGFRKRFSRLAGVPPARYRAARSIERACELMTQGRLTDREIAAALGFCDEFHFSHRFRQVTGKSPRKFRATIGQ
ncbi:helix-turn-helix domain-containing protein [Actinopolymorpha alba]|uniref:helix-turn-helix domain-containing protein n=1 Tax=Actinopolymorpha alba TaxID=533267 RepID=UPI00035D1B4B|nr:AraC family transcriptional regulator [Actinopolymorpha alba]